MDAHATAGRAGRGRWLAGLAFLAALAALWMVSRSADRTLSDDTAAPAYDVALDGQAPHRSVQAAIDAAAAGAVIRIGPGTFDGRVAVGKALTLVGAGADATTLIADVSMAPGERRHLGENEAAIRPTLAVDVVGDVVIRDLALTGRSPWKLDELRDDAVVLVVRANARFERCAIWNCGANGVIVGTDAALALEHCLIAAIGSRGVLVRGGKRTRISDCDLRDCGSSCISLSGGSDDIIERSRISGSRWPAVFAYGGSPTIRGNVFFDNDHAGLDTYRSRALVEDNLFLEQKLDGMSSTSANDDTIRRNTFVNNGRMAVSVEGGATPKIHKNLIVGSPLGVAGNEIGGREAEYFAGRLHLDGNWFWETDRVAVVPATDGATGYADVPWRDLEAAGNVRAAPGFADPEHGDYSLPASAPARAAGVGALAPLSAKSPWPLRPEEIAWRKRKQD